MNYILSGIIAAVVLIGGIFVGHGLNTQQAAPQSYGAFTPVQASQFSLAGAGITNSQNTIQLASFLLPDPNKTPITMSMFGSIGYGVVDPQTSKIENVSFTGVTQNANGSATLTGVSRGLSFYAPYSASTTLALSHAGGATLILSNSGAFYGTQFLFANNNGTSTAVLAFSSSTPPHYDLDLSQTQWGLLSTTTIPDIAYVNRISIAGAANSSETVNGISQLSTAAQAAAGTSAGSTGARLVLPGSLANATPSATTIVPITSTLGKLAQGFLDLTQAFSVSGVWSFLNNISVMGTSSLATTTINGSTALATYFGDGIDGNLTISAGATTTLTRDTYYNNLTVNGALVTNGCRVFVANTISGTGSINFGLASAGGNGGNGSSGNAGAGGAPSATTTTSCDFKATPGTAGGAGGGSAGASGVAGANSISLVPILNTITGSVGGNGGNGSTGTGAAGGTAGSFATTTKFGEFADNVIRGLDSPTTTLIYASTNRYIYLSNVAATGGGGGGSVNSGAGGSGGGGGGGSAGGIIWLFAKTWSGTFNILSLGGTGGTGGNGNSGGDGVGGGGAGGNGGVSVVVYNTKTWTGTYSLTGGAAGSKGASGSMTAATNGNAGSVGTSYEFNFANLIR